MKKNVIQFQYFKHCLSVVWCIGENEEWEIGMAYKGWMLIGIAFSNGIAAIYIRKTRRSNQANNNDDSKHTIKYTQPASSNVTTDDGNLLIKNTWIFFYCNYMMHLNVER